MQVHINQHMNSFAFRICSCYSLCLEYTPILNFAAFDEHLSGPGLNFTFSAQLSVLVRLSTRSPRYWLPWCSLFIVIRLLNCRFFLPGSKFSKGQYHSYLVHHSILRTQTLLSTQSVTQMCVQSSSWNKAARDQANRISACWRREASREAKGSGGDMVDLRDPPQSYLLQLNIRYLGDLGETAIMINYSAKATCKQIKKVIKQQ